MPDAAQGERDAGVEADDTLVDLFRVCMNHDAPVTVKQLAQLARYAGLDSQTITASQTRAKENLGPREWPHSQPASGDHHE